jgi:restriction endonuclease S subunit
MGEVLKLRNERGSTLDPLLSVTADQGVVPQNETGRRDISNDDKSAYRRVYKDDIVYNTMRMWQGVSARSSYFGIVSPAYTVCSPMDEIDARFMAQLLHLPRYVQLFKNRSQGLVSDTWNLTFSSFKDIPVSIPVLSEQRGIADILDSLDTAIEATCRLIEKVERHNAGLLGNLMSRGLTELGTHNSSSEAVVSIGGVPVPSWWRRGRVAEFGDVLLGRQRSPAHEAGNYQTPYLRVANVFDGWVDYSNVSSMNFTPAERERYGLLPGDLLLNEGQSLELVGRCAVYGGDPKSHCFQNTLVRYRCHPDVYPTFAYLQFKHYLHTRRFIAIAKQTTSIAHLGAARFAGMETAFPSLEEQIRISEIYSAGRERLNLERRQLAGMRAVKRGLMEDLLTGRVRVEVGEVGAG